MTRSNTPLLATLVALAAFVGGGCAAHPKPPAAAAARAEPQYPVIVRLVGRHYAVTASSGPTGVVWSAQNADGRTVVANATLDELRKSHPEVYQQILPAIATQGDGANTRRREDADEAKGNDPIPLGTAAQPAGASAMRDDMLLLMDASR